MFRKTLLSLYTLLGLANLPVAQAQSPNTNWPQRPITIIVAAQAGGLGDTIGRTLADGLSTHLGQTVIVENRSGASGTIGLQATLRAPGDGYTYVIGYPSMMINSQLTIKNLPFNIKRAFQAVAGIAITELVMSVNASVPAKEPQELIAWLKNQSGHLSYGSYGEGSYAHVAGYHLGALYGFDAVHVPYKGEQPMLLAIASNDVVYGIGTLTAGKTMQDTGKTRMIGFLTPTRSRYYPDLPTFKESGITDPAFQFLGAWYGLFARSDVPAPVVEKMQQAVIAVLNSPTMQQRLTTLSLVPWGATAAELDATWSAEMPLHHNLLRLAGVEIYE